MCCSLIMGVLSAVAYAISLITFAQWQSQNCSIFDHATREIVIGIDEMSEKRSELAVRADIEEILCKQQVYFNIFLAFGLLISVLLIAGACTVSGPFVNRMTITALPLFVTSETKLVAVAVAICQLLAVDCSGRHRFLRHHIGG